MNVERSENDLPENPGVVGSLNYFATVQVYDSYVIVPLRTSL